MKREDLFKAIGDVDDDLLDENVAPARRWNPARFAFSAAACAVFAAGGVFAYTHLHRAPVIDPESSSVGASFTETVTDVPYTEETTGSAPPRATAGFSGHDGEGEYEVDTAEGNTGCLAPGIWLSQCWYDDVEQDSYYWFSDSGTGEIMQQYDGSIQSFTYYFMETDYEDGHESMILELFGIGESNSTRVMIDVYATDDSRIGLVWPDGHIDEITYYDDIYFNSFRFYSTMAIEYAVQSYCYEELSIKEWQYVESFIDLDDADIYVILHEMDDSELTFHVNRFSGEATDESYDRIDLSPYLDSYEIFD